MMTGGIHHEILRSQLRKRRNRGAINAVGQLAMDEINEKEAAQLMRLLTDAIKSTKNRPKEATLMNKPNLTIPINPDLGNQAQAVFNDMGLDIVTAIDCFLRQAIQDKSSVVAFIGNQNINMKDKPAKFEGWEGKAIIADDFSAPLDDFEAPNNSPEERLSILRSLVGSIDDPTFIVPPEVVTPDAPRNWELMDL